VANEYAGSPRYLTAGYSHCDIIRLRIVELIQVSFLSNAGSDFCLRKDAVQNGKVVWFLPKVVLRPGESQGSLLKRFRKKVARSKVLSTVRKKRWFISTSEERRIAKQKAIRKQQRRLTDNKGRSRQPKAPTTFPSRG